MPSTHTTFATQTETPFIGLAPFLRVSISGIDVQPIAEDMLASAETSADDANLWMNLSTAMLCLGQREIGLSLQDQALQMKRTYHLPASEQPAKLRLLMLMAQGDLSANTPLDCLLENSDIDLDFYYLTPGHPFAQPVPEHDVLLVALSESDENQEFLVALEQILQAWPKPVINAPQHIPSVGRENASRLLHKAPGLLMPPTLRASRAVLNAIAIGETKMAEVFGECDFPVILRPVGSHAGRDLARIECPEEIADYLAQVHDADFYISPFIDYRSQDGHFRKMRVALIDGVPFACHMAISSHWMIHYVNAGMYEEAWKRSEEATFMENFEAFSRRHQSALEAIYHRTKLDYVCIDCAATPDGQLLVFEIDHAMVVHAMDPEDQFPYKPTHMQKVKNAFRDFLFRRTATADQH